MPIIRIEVERLQCDLYEPFDKVVETLKSAVGRPDMGQFAKATREAGTFTELESQVEQ